MYHCRVSPIDSDLMATHEVSYFIEKLKVALEEEEKIRQNAMGGGK